MDAQAPALAATVRALGALPYGYGDWQGRALELLSELYLTARAWSIRDGLSARLLADLRTAIGFIQSADTLLDAEPVVDVWMVLGKQTSEEGALTVEKHWLAGAGTDRTALFLQFLIRGEGGKVRLTPGTTVCAALKFYPAAVPLRVAADAVEFSDIHPQPQTVPHWAAMCAQQTAEVAASPFAAERPYILAGLQPLRYAEQWWLADADGQRMSLHGSEDALWTYLAASGGHPLPTAVLGRERSYALLGFWKDNRYHAL